VVMSVIMLLISLKDKVECQQSKYFFDKHFRAAFGSKTVSN
jgi:hypothetical protein